MYFDGKLEKLKMKEMVDNGVMKEMMKEDWKNVKVEKLRNIIEEERKKFIEGSVIEVIEREV